MRSIYKTKHEPEFYNDEKNFALIIHNTQTIIEMKRAKNHIHMNTQKNVKEKSSEHVGHIKIGRSQSV